ncbi:polymorphic toxin-type HINT domain-containing protein [Paenibacillus kobensis]|uniref:polymorphic toxin-type HINT domain-containing protein n=1 Tax=Paenibacillus kobensis TaxID=59841 RepID=UPI000FDC24DE|nr:polymorphic toxin-type HINT domain-containing protein [Paenibacillus kobensis]
MKRWRYVAVFAFLLAFLPMKWASAETLEEQLNNLIGPQQQYNTKLSPVYLRTNTPTEDINPQSGDFSLVQTDYVLPGRNGLDLEIKRIYKSGSGSVEEMNVHYVNGAWVDFVKSDHSTATFYENRYNLGIGMRFSFPTIEIKVNKDGSSYKFLHTDSGDVYRLSPDILNGEIVLLPSGQTIRDIVVKETAEFSNGQAEGVSKYVMTGKDGKKTYFDKDGVILGIVDRYGNKIVFENTKLEYKLGSGTITKKVVTKITDTVGRVTTIEYKEDANYQVKPLSDVVYDGDQSYKQSQNPDKSHSGDLEGKFQVIVHLPNGKELVYDKTAALADSTQHVLRTRLQRVFDTDGMPKYHYWYEQPELGFTFMSKDTYSAYNRYESLEQIDYVKTNRLTRYMYESYKKSLSDDGSMQYRKLFEKRELVKTGFDKGKTQFLDRFLTVVKDKTTYAYTNEPDGYGFAGYMAYDTKYLADTYRYYSEETDALGSKTKYTYDGKNQLLVTEKYGKDHKDVIRTERDEMKLIKKKETLQYNVQGGQAQGEPLKRIENFRYDQYGNLTNYTGPEAPRDANGEPLDNEHMVVYTYAYDKFHALTSKTWKQDKNTSAQTMYDVDAKGNITRETKAITDDKKQWIMTDYDYDLYGNVIQKKVSSDGQSVATNYEYGTDADGRDTKGAYLTREYGTLKGQAVGTRYAYDWTTGNRTAKIDANSGRTDYAYDTLNRLISTTDPEGGQEAFVYEENRFANLQIQYTDPNKNVFRYEYDTAGAQLKESLKQGNAWKTLGQWQYDAHGKKVKDTDGNGTESRFEYDSAERLVKKSVYDKNGAFKAATSVAYRIGENADVPLTVTITDEEGYPKRYVYDINSRLVRLETTPDNSTYYTNRNEYNYTGNLIAQTDARLNTTRYRYDAAGQLRSKQDALGNETTYSYHPLGQVALQKEPDGRTTSYAFDELGRATQMKVYTEGSADYTYESYKLDSAGHVIELRKGQSAGGVDAVASAVSYEYDGMGRVTAEKTKIDDVRTGIAVYAYDKKGNRTSETYYADAAKKKFRLFEKVYDYAGRVTEDSGRYKDLTAGSGGTEYGSYRTVYERDAVGNVMKQNRYNGTGYDTTAYDYDYRNLVTEKREPYAGKAEAKVTRYAYDKTGRVLSETLKVQGNELTTSYLYDGLGRAVRVTDPIGNASRYVYDENGNRIKEIDPRYSAQPLNTAPGIEAEYDALNRPVTTYVFDGKSRTVLSYKRYDGRGNIIMEAQGEGYNAADPTTSIGTTAEYDALNRKVRIVSAQTAADNRKNGTSYATAIYAYDGAGNVITETDANGAATHYAYYGNGLLREKAYPDESKETFDYDLTGKSMVAAKDRNGAVTTRFMNVFDQPYRIEYPDGTAQRFEYSPLGLMTKRIDQAGGEQRFEYDEAGRVTAQTAFISAGASTSSFQRIEQRYDEAGRLLSKETFLYEAPRTGGQAAVKTSAGDKAEYFYDKAGRLQRESGPNGRETLYEYDRAGNAVLKKEKVADNDYEMTRYGYDVQSRPIAESKLVRLSELAQQELAGASFDDEFVDRVLATTKYGYNKNGQLTSREDAKGNTATYAYDLDNRLVKETDPLRTAKGYRYDRKGQLVEATDAMGVSTVYEYDAEGRLLREKAPAADGSTAVKRYVYDAAGNLIKEIKPNQYDASKDNPSDVLAMAGTAYTYDKMNRRTTSVAPDGRTLEYIAYDALGRVRKTVDGIRYDGSIDSSDGTVVTYDGLGRVTSRKDGLGNTVKQEYDALGNLTKNTDARGNETVYVYNADGTVQRVEYADDSVVAYSYDKLGRKISERNPLGAVSKSAYNAFGSEKSTTDANGVTTEMKYDLAGHLLSSKDKRGNVTLYKYDAKGQLVETRTPLERDGSGSIVYSIETYVYDAAGNLLKQSVQNSKDSSYLRESSYTYYDNKLVRTSSDNSGASVENFYDKSGNLIRTETLRTASEKDVERFIYDLSDRMVQRIQLVDESGLESSVAAGAAGLKDKADASKIQLITSYEYDLLGNRTQETDPRGYVLQYVYDALNQLTKLTRQSGSETASVSYEYDKNGNRISEKNELGFETIHEYDEMNRVTAVTDGEHHTMRYEYDLAGNKLSETNALGNRMSYSYDKLNRLVTVKDPYNVVIKHNVYDTAGNVLKEIDAAGYLSGSSDDQRYSEEYVYDLAGRMTSKTDRMGYKTTYKYNTSGDLVKETNPLGEAYVYEYDNGGSLVKVTDPLGIATSYNYDLAGNKVAMTDGRGKMTRYKYGAFGLLLELVNPDGKPVVYRYDLGSNIAEMTDKNGRHTSYEYDSRNLLLKQSVAETGETIQFTYDKAGNRASMSDASGMSRYAYDGNNRLKTVTKGGTVQLSYMYDAVGNVESVKDKKGNATAYTYDKANRMATVAANGKTTTYNYDEGGNRTSIVYPGGVKESYTYDRNNRLLTLRNLKANGTVLSSYTYGYDGAGRQTSKTDSYGKTLYGYDADGRVKKVEAPGKTTVYAYDDSGNRQSMNETYVSDQPSGYTEPSSGKAVTYLVKKSEYNYSNANVLKQLVERMYDDEGEEVLEKTTGYLYDDNGNELRSQVSYVRPHDRSLKQTTGANASGDGISGELNVLLEKTSNTFDGFNRLIKAERIQGSVRSSVTYTYDGDGLRTQKVSRSSKDNNAAHVTNYLYDRRYVVLETDESDAVTTRYVRGVNYIARVDAAMKASYFLFNGHGDVVHTVNGAGEVENTYDYDIFGNPLLTIEVYASSIRYSGEFYDAEVGLYYLRARYYDPYISRFISEDTYAGRDEDPLSLNRYTYVLNDPLMYWDPTGHKEVQLTDLSNATDSKIKYDSKTKTATVTLATGYEVQFTAGKNGAKGEYGVYINEKGKMIIDNDAFDAKVAATGPQNGATVKVDTYVSDEVRDKKGKILESEKIGAVKVVTSYEGRKVEVDKAIVYDTNSQKKLLTTTSSQVPNDLSQMSGSGVYYTPAQSLLIAYSVRDGSLNDNEVKALHLRNAEVVSIHLWAMDQSEAGRMIVSSVTNVNSGFNDYTASGIAMPKSSKKEPAPPEPASKEKNASSSKNSQGSSKPAAKTTSSECNCFTAGTKVQTDEGEKNIEDIEVGDKVLSKDEATGEVAYKEVTATFNHETDEIYKIHVGGQTIESTFNHPFYVEDKGWTFVKDLKVGDLLVQSDGNTLEITSIELLHKYVTVYNMTVDEFHTYFVSDLGIWVHNTNGCLRPEAKYLKGGKHGVNWTEGSALAKSSGIAQGQWSKADLEYAGAKASTLEKGQGAWFDLPPGSTSVVHMPDGTTVPATRMWVRNNGTGTFHGYPAP